MGSGMESKDIPVFHIDFYTVTSVSSSKGDVITELAPKGEGEGHVPTCWNTP
jgi:hypothetical protein